MLLLAACASALPDEENPVTEAPLAATDGPAAADFDIVLYTGPGALGERETRFSELLDQGKPVVLNMWAGLCPPCRLEMPDFQEVSSEYSAEVLFFGLDVGPFANLGTSQDGQDLVQELGIAYPTGTTSDASIVQEYELLGMPTTYFITSDGQIARQWTGLLTADKLEELVTELIQADGSS
jgi:thiol-disulfide isomerase/thioredoxin